MSEQLQKMPPIESEQQLITGVPEFPNPMEVPPNQDVFRGGEELGKTERKLNFLERMKLGKDELAICGVVDMNPSDRFDGDEKIDDQSERLIIMDVGFRKSKDGRYGPYDIDGTGTKRYFDKPYVVLNARSLESTEDEPSDADSVLKYVEVGDNEEITIGRTTVEGMDLGIDRNDKISRSHTTLKFGGNNGVIEVVDNKSLNGVRVYAPGELVDASGSSYDYTVNVADYVHQSGKGNYYKDSSETEGRGHGEYAGRPIIARDTEINEGVYPVGGTHGEALVIDDVKYPKELTEVYEKITERIRNPSARKMSLRGLKRVIKGEVANNDGMDANSATLQAVFDVVSDTLHYDLEATNALAQDSQKISINTYIEEGVGVCRTQAALAAYQVERLIKSGELQGKVSIDRSSRVDPDGDGSGHAWARFMDEKGRVYVIDPAQKYVGSIHESPDRNWDYRRTEDIIKQLTVAK